MNIGAVISNVLVVSALLILIYIYYPIIALYTPLPDKKVHESTYSIEIPKINAYAPIIANVNPWDKSEYEEALSNGVAKAKDFADFGEDGTIFMFAHASLSPWEMTRTNTAFLRLNELHINDEIIITKFDQKYKYKVIEKKEVWPTDVNSTLHTDSNQLILQTSIPLGTDLKRLLIYARPTTSL